MSEIDPREEREERAILSALEVLGNEERAAMSSEEIRPWVELLGLLPYGMDAEAPRPELRAALMARVSGAVPDDLARFEAPSRATGPGQWMLRLAAVLAIALLGLSIRQASDLARRSEEIVFQQARIQELTARLQGVVPASGTVPDWTIASGTELCELRPQSAGAESSRGWLFVRSDHQHWYVTVAGLAPAPEGHIYELWFMADGQPVSGGRFEPDGEGQAALTSETMPTGITGIAITLEPIEGEGRPSEKTVLYGDEPMVTL